MKKTPYTAGGVERNREHKRLQMQRKEGYKEKSRKENRRWGEFC